MDGRSPVSIADEEVNIIYVASLLGVYVPEIGGLRSSIKIDCPFGDLYHSDGGIEAALRLYPETNTGWCFAEQLFFTPTSLYQRGRNLSRKDAAEELLEKIGYRSPGFQFLWEEASGANLAIDRDALGEALKEYCRRIALRWDEQQYEEETSRVLGQCLGLLEKVETESDVAAWLGTCKQVMARQLER